MGGRKFFFLQRSRVSRPDPAAVEATFSSVAKRYDLANHWLSGGIDFYWRKCLVKLARQNKPMDLLDLATGSGDVLFALRKGLGDKINLTGLDFCEPMLEQARAKRTVRGLVEGDNQFLHGDCLNLPFEDDSFDLITIAFGLRNLADRAKGLGKCTEYSVPVGALSFLSSVSLTFGFAPFIIYTCVGFFLGWHAGLLGIVMPTSIWVQA